MNLLFSQGELDNALSRSIRELVAEVQQWAPDQLLTQSENEIASYLADKYSVACPILRRDDIYADEPADIQIEVNDWGGDRIRVPATRLRVHVPYDGERTFFGLKPNTFTYSPPRADVYDNEIVLTYEARQLDGDRVRGDMDRELQEIEQWLSWSRGMAEAHNSSLLEKALSVVQHRKEKLLADRRTVAGLGIPVRRSGDAPTYAVPVQRRKPSVARPVPTSSDYAPEPTLSDGDYEEAVRVIRNACRQLERSPTTALRLDEEERRDLLLVALNSQFEGQAGGEVFNGAGKTDILLRVDDRNVFIAECKIWRGAKSIHKAVDQLLSYLVWRDTKAALIIFIETKAATDAIQKAAQVVTDHPRCVRALAPVEPAGVLHQVL